ELTQRAWDIAEGLVASGLKPKEIVAVTGTRSFGLITAMLGAWMARGVLLTLDRRLPYGRCLLMMKESQARILLYAGAEPTSETTNLPCIRIDDAGCLLTRINKEQPAFELPRVLPEDPAYIFCTSGTTGTPKAILGWHMGLSHFVSWQ